MQIQDTRQGLWNTIHSVVGDNAFQYITEFVDQLKDKFYILVIMLFNTFQNDNLMGRGSQDDPGATVCSTLKTIFNTFYD